MKRYLDRRFFGVVAALLLLTTFSLAQAAEVREGVLDSKLTARKMPYRVVVPPGYDAKENASNRYPVIYLLHGLTGHYDNWTTRTKIAEYAGGYGFLVVTPEGDNGWYTDSPTKPNDKYETYIVKELIPEIDSKFRTRAERRSRAIAGLSMGGYGALKFGIKYPEMFALAGSFSGALSVPTDGWSFEFARPSITVAFGSKDSETVKANDIFALIRAASPEKLKAMPYFYLDCGTEDFLIAPNRDLSALLLEKKLPHEFRQLPGIHDWKYWDKQVQEFLRIADRTIVERPTAAVR